MLFLILVDDNDRFCIVRYLLINNRSLVFGVLDIAEKLFDLCFYLVYINITNDDQSLVIRVIPLVIIVDKLLAFEVVYHTHQANRVA